MKYIKSNQKAIKIGIGDYYIIIGSLIPFGRLSPGIMINLGKIRLSLMLEISEYKNKL